MRHHMRLLSVVQAMALTSVCAYSAVRTFELGSNGELLASPPRLSVGDQFQVKIRKPRGSSPHLWLAAQLLDEVRQPSGEVENWQGAKKFTCESDGDFCNSGVLKDLVGKQHKMLLYAVFGRWEENVPDTKALETKLAEARIALTAIDDGIADNNHQISDLTDQAKQFQGMSTPEAVANIRNLQARIETLRKVVAADKPNRAAAKAALDTAGKALTDGLLKSNHVIRAGAIIIGSRSKVVNYHLLRGGGPAMPVRLERLADYPAFQQDDEIWIDITNVRTGSMPEQFNVSANQTVEAAPNTAPVRPSFEKPPNTAQVQELVPKPIVHDTCIDVIRALGIRPKPNGVIKVTISAYLTTEASNKTTTADGQAKTEVVAQTSMVKLIDGVEYPQIHALYPYNISTGLLISSLRDPTFTKNKTKAAVLDDAGKVKTPAEYQVVTDKGEPRPMPALFFTWYVKSFDAQRKWTPGDLIPRPSLGFSLTAPSENFFFGGSSEITRNVQLAAGWHYGKVTVRGPIPVDDANIDTVPATVKRFQSGAYFGLTFNIAFIKALFGK